MSLNISILLRYSVFSRPQWCSPYLLWWR